jgi:hypothetical protein
LGELRDLLKHNNLNSDFLDFYFDKLSKLDKDKFKNQIKIYCPFMNVKLCNKYSIKKEKLEKDRFFELYEKIINSDTSKINQIVSDEYTFPKELPRNDIIALIQLWRVLVPIDTQKYYDAVIEIINRNFEVSYITELKQKKNN